MMKLRDKYKTMARESILESAMALITEHGFAKTTIEKIAEHCGVAVGTVYNHFPSKNDVLIALSEFKTDVLRREGEKIITGTITEPVLAVKDLIWAYQEPLLESPKKVLQEIFALCFSNMESFGRIMVENENIFAEQLLQLLKRLQAEHRVTESLDLRTVTKTLIGCRAYVFRHYLQDVMYTTRQAEQDLADMVALLWNAIQPVSVK